MENMTTEELLNDYVSFHWMEGNIDEKQRVKMQEAIKDYLKQIDLIQKAENEKGWYRN